VSAKPARGPAMSAADRRFQARRRLERRRRAARVTFGLLALAIVGGLGWLIGWSDVLAADEVRVEGVDEPLSSSVLEAAAVPLGTPLARLDTDGIAGRVAELPDVAGVSVERSWPSAVTLDVTARTPVAAVPDDDTWWQVDASGILFAASSERPEDLPTLKAGTEDDDAEARLAGVAVIATLPDDLAGQVVEVRAGTPGDVRLILADDVEVRWGTAENAPRKAEVLAALMAAQEEPAERYDVSAPEAPAVVP
jgi:cell division protein FtsQ